MSYIYHLNIISHNKKLGKNKIESLSQKTPKAKYKYNPPLSQCKKNKIG